MESRVSQTAPQATLPWPARAHTLENFVIILGKNCEDVGGRRLWCGRAREGSGGRRRAAHPPLVGRNIAAMAFVWRLLQSLCRTQAISCGKEESSVPNPRKLWEKGSTAVLVSSCSIFNDYYFML